MGRIEGREGRAHKARDSIYKSLEASNSIAHLETSCTEGWGGEVTLGGRGKGTDSKGAVGSCAFIGRALTLE